jgi:hypothetical protein
MCIVKLSPRSILSISYGKPNGKEEMILTSSQCFNIPPRLLEISNRKFMPILYKTIQGSNF